MTDVPRDRPPSPPPTGRTDGARVIRRRRIAALVVIAGAVAGAVRLLPGGGDTDSGTGVIAGGPLTQGRYAQVGSFRGPSAARKEARRLEAAGVSSVVRDSDEISELLPAFFVLVSGPLASPDAERRVLVQADRAGVAGARVRFMTPATTPRDKPRGVFAGTLRRRASPTNRAIAVTMRFAHDGETGTVELDVPSCRGDLRLSDTKAATRIYTEIVTRGDCLSGGQWSVKRLGGDLLVTWWHPKRTYFVLGTLNGA